MRLAIRNDILSDTDWGKVSKPALQNQVAAAGPRAVRECYAIVGDIDDPATWLCPHHQVSQGILVVNPQGVSAAKAALHGARSPISAPPNAIARGLHHLARHERAIERQHPARRTT